MSFGFSAGAIRDLISQLERLEEAQLQAERSQTSQQPVGGYSRGDPRRRAAALGPLVSPTPFPAISQIAQLWTVCEEAGPDFVGDQSVSLEDGPGRVPALLEGQADFVSWNTRQAVQRIHSAFFAGFWARISLKIFSKQNSDRVLSTPPVHFIVLRACGVGGSVRFTSEEHFNRFLDQTVEEGLLAFGFATETELHIFCQGAKIAVPPSFKPACRPTR